MKNTLSKISVAKIPVQVACVHFYIQSILRLVSAQLKH